MNPTPSDVLRAAAMHLEALAIKERNYYPDPDNAPGYITGLDLAADELQLLANTFDAVRKDGTS